MFSVSMVKHSDQKQLKKEVGHLALGSRGTEGAHHGGASVGWQQVLGAERAHFLFTQETGEASKNGNEDKVPRSLHLVMHILREDRTSRRFHNLHEHKQL